MKKVSVYLRNSNRGPSDYYRICQYLPKLNIVFRIRNAETEEEFKKNLNMPRGLYKKIYQSFLYFKIYFRRVVSFADDYRWKPDVIIIQREIFPHLIGLFASLLFLGLCKRTTVVWDFDDDIFLSREIGIFERYLLEKKASKIVVTNKHLASLLRNKGKEKVTLLPTTDGFKKKYNVRYYRRKLDKIYDKEIRLVWVGTKSNLHNVENVLDMLDEAAKIVKEKCEKKLVLSIVCNVPLQRKTKYIFVRNVEWSRDVAEKEILRSHVGIMPLENTEFAKGKGGFKLVQYISVGLPVLASRVGFNSEIVDEHMGMLVSPEKIWDWTDKVVKISIKKELWKELGYFAEKRYSDEFSFDKNVSEWEKIINEV